MVLAIIIVDGDVDVIKFAGILSYRGCRAFVLRLEGSLSDGVVVPVAVDGASQYLASPRKINKTNVQRHC